MAQGKNYKKKKYRGRKTSSVSSGGGGAPYRNMSYSRGLVPKYGNMKFKAAFQCQTTGVGITTMNHGFRLTQPDNFDGSGNAVTDWSSAANLYDEYRVRGIKIKFLPQRPNDAQSGFFNPVYVFADFDSTGLNPTVATCVGYDNLSVHNLFMPWKRYVRIPKLANYSSTTISRPGWMDTASPAVTGSLYMHSENLTAQTEYGKILITYYITFHNRK